MIRGCSEVFLRELQPSHATLLHTGMVQACTLVSFLFLFQRSEDRESYFPSCCSDFLLRMHSEQGWLRHSSTLLLMMPQSSTYDVALPRTLAFWLHQSWPHREFSTEKVRKKRHGAGCPHTANSDGVDVETWHFLCCLQRRVERGKTQAIELSSDVSEIDGCYLWKSSSLRSFSRGVTIVIKD